MTQNHLPTDPNARSAMEEALSRISPLPAAERFWDRVLTAEERRQLGDDRDAAILNYGAVGMWVQLRGVTGLRAILDVAHALTMLSDTDYRWLLREIGAPAETGMPGRPHWNHIEGKLNFRNKVIRQLRKNKNPTNLQIILDAFQAANWTPKIANPLKGGPQQLHETLRTLNDDLKQIRFHSQEGGQAILWESKPQ